MEAARGPRQRRRNHERTGRCLGPLRTGWIVVTGPIRSAPRDRPGEDRSRRPRSGRQGRGARAARRGLSRDLCRTVAVARSRRANGPRRRRRLAGIQPPERGTHDACAAADGTAARKGLEHVGVLVGGIIPEDDVPKLQALGVRAVFGPGTTIPEIVGFLQKDQRRNADLTIRSAAFAKRIGTPWRGC